MYYILYAPKLNSSSYPLHKPPFTHILELYCIVMTYWTSIAARKDAVLGDNLRN